MRRKATLEEQLFGSQSMQVAQTLDFLADLYSEDANYAEAEATLRSALAIRAAIDGPESATADYGLARLAGVVGHQQKLAEAEQLYREILTRQTRYTGHEDFTVLAKLADVYRLAKDYPRAEETNQQALQLELGSEQPGSGLILGTIERLGTVYEEQGKYVQEETLYRDAAESRRVAQPFGTKQL